MKNTSGILVVLPTYNESENISELCKILLGKGENVELCVVDDSPNDETVNVVYNLVDQVPSWKSRVSLHKRTGKLGRGSAVRYGLNWGAEQSRFKYFIEMDCDFSHDPQVIDSGIELLSSGWDFVVGSRYPIGQRPNWPISRRILSYFANHALRVAIPSAIQDYTSGYRFYNRNAVEFLIPKIPRYAGFIYLSEVLSLLTLAGAKITSFPICHPFRRRGSSSVGVKELLSSLIGMFSLGVRHWSKLIGSKTLITTQRHIHP